MGQILEQGMAAVREGEQRRAFVNEAASRFEALGIPEATQLGQLTREHPDAAHAWAAQNGGWGNLYNMMRADAGRRQLGDAMAKLQGAGLSQQAVLQQLIPIAVQYGVGADQLGQIAKAYGTPDPQAFDWEHTDPGKYTPESYAAGWQSRDPRLLRERVREAAPNRADYTGASWSQYHQSGDSSVLVPIPKPAGDGASSESRALDLENKKLDLKRRQAEEYVRQAYEDDAAGKPITAGRARLVNNINKMYPDPLGLQRPQFVPANLAPDVGAGGGMDFSDLSKKAAAPPAPPVPEPAAPPRHGVEVFQKYMADVRARQAAEVAAERERTRSRGRGRPGGL